MQSAEDVIRLRFIAVITDGYICSDIDRKLFALSIKFGGLNLLDYCEIQNIEYLNSRKVTKDLTEYIILQNQNF